RKVARAVTARKLLILISTRTAGGSRPALRPLPRREERVGGVAPTYGLPASVTDIVRPRPWQPTPNPPAVRSSDGQHQRGNPRTPLPGRMAAHGQARPVGVLRTHPRQ